MERVGIRWIRGEGDLRVIEDTDLAFSSPEFQNLMIYDKGVEGFNTVFGHDLEYTPTFDAYAKLDGKYFINYSTITATNYAFENTVARGTVRTAPQQMNVLVEGGEIVWCG